MAGYNDTPVSARLPIPLTSGQHSVRAIGRNAMQTLLDLLAGEQPTSATFAFEAIGEGQGVDVSVRSCQ
jgi:LacI family transcriptional regulator